MLDLPQSPTLNQQFQAGLVTWRWDGVKWINDSTAIGPYLPLVGGSLTGGLTIAPASTHAALTLNKPTTDGTANIIWGSRNGVFRWNIDFGNADSETGSNAGSNFAINCWSDTGVLLATPLQINRATSVVTVNNNLVINSTTAQLELRKSASGQACNIFGMRGTLARWVIVPGGNQAETGSNNVGSDFLIARYTDAGALIDVALTIQRTNANASFAGTIGTYGIGDPGASNNYAGFSSKYWRFAQSAGDEVNAGVIGYRNFDPICLGIVGAGTTGTNRKVRIWDQLGVYVTPPADSLEGNVFCVNGYTFTGQLTQGGLHWNAYRSTAAGAWSRVNGTDPTGLFRFTQSGDFEFYRAPAAAVGVAPAWSLVGSISQYGSYYSNSTAMMHGDSPNTGYNAFYGNNGSVFIYAQNHMMTLYRTDAHSFQTSDPSGAGQLAKIDTNGWRQYTGHIHPGVDNSLWCGVSAWGLSWYNCCAYTFVNASDVRKKTDLNDLPDCLDIVQAIKPQRFHWNNDPEFERWRLHWGFVAQQVGEVMQNAGYDFSGGYRVENDNHGLVYSNLVAVLWKAVQELTTEVKALRALVT